MLDMQMDGADIHVMSDGIQNTNDGWQNEDRLRSSAKFG